MNDIEKYRTRKNGYFTPEDVLKETKDIIDQNRINHVITIVQTDDGTVHRFNTELTTLELYGLLEFAKFIDEDDE